jgi:GGDEF domain-containing protein
MIRRGEPFALVVADLDRFKQLNDRHRPRCGRPRPSGLRQTAERALRDGDLIARWAERSS